MSISRWYGTWCDTCGVETDVMPTWDDSRELAKQSGWEVGVRDPDRPNGRLRDYCPDHRETSKPTDQEASP